MDGKKFLHEQSSKIVEPIELNVGMVLTGDDIETVLSEQELKTFLNRTLAFKIKQGFPTYHLDSQARLLIINDYEKKKVSGFRLKKSSALLKKFIDKYEKQE